MTKKQLKEGLKKILTEQEQKPDPEKYRYAADVLLLEFINDEEVTELYDKIDGFYA